MITKAIDPPVLLYQACSTREKEKRKFSGLIRSK